MKLLYIIFYFFALPRKLWDLAEKTTRDQAVINYLYPLISINALIALIGEFIEKGLERDSLQSALTQASFVAIAVFASYFIITHILYWSLTKLFATPKPKQHVDIFVAFSMTFVSLLRVNNVLFGEANEIVYNVIYFVISLFSWLSLSEGVERFLSIKPAIKCFFLVFFSMSLLFLIPEGFIFLFNYLSQLMPS